MSGRQGSHNLFPGRVTHDGPWPEGPAFPRWHRRERGASRSCGPVPLTSRRASGAELALVKRARMWESKIRTVPAVGSETGSSRRVPWRRRGRVATTDCVAATDRCQPGKWSAWGQGESQAPLGRAWSVLPRNSHYEIVHYFLHLLMKKQRLRDAEEGTEVTQLRSAEIFLPPRPTFLFLEHRQLNRRTNSRDKACRPLLLTQCLTLLGLGLLIWETGPTVPPL